MTLDVTSGNHTELLPAASDADGRERPALFAPDLEWTFASEAWRARLAPVVELLGTQEARATLVKSNELRRVWLVHYPSVIHAVEQNHGLAAPDRATHDPTPEGNRPRGRACFYVKEHLAARFGARLKSLVRGSPAKAEYRASRYAAEHGVPAVEIVAWATGERGVSLTLSPAEEEAVPLSQAFEDVAATGDAAARKQRIDGLIEGVAGLLAAAHEARFVAADMHPGNILVRRKDAAFHCVFVDLYGARRGRSVDDVTAARNLAALNQWFQSRASRSQRLRLLKRYIELTQGGFSAGRFKQFAKLALDRAERHAQILYRKRDRRIGRDNAFFGKMRTPGGRAWVALRRRYLHRSLPVSREALDRQGWANRLAEPASLRNDSTAESFFSEGSVAGLTWRFGGSPAWRRFRTSWLALHRGIPAAGGLACVERGAVFVRHCVWLSAAPQEGVSFTAMMARERGALRRSALEQAGRLLADTATHGLVIRNPALHRVGVTCAAGDVRVYWRGIEGMALRRPLPEHVWRWTLASLAADRALRGLTTADRARVLRRFCQRMGRADRGDWRELYRWIASRMAEQSP